MQQCGISCSSFLYFIEIQSHETTINSTKFLLHVFFVNFRGVWIFAPTLSSACVSGRYHKIRNIVTSKWRQIRHVFADTPTLRARSPDILVELSGQYRYLPKLVSIDSIDTWYRYRAQSPLSGPTVHLLYCVVEIRVRNLIDYKDRWLHLRPKFATRKFDL